MANEVDQAASTAADASEGLGNGSSGASEVTDEQIVGLGSDASADSPEAVAGAAQAAPETETELAIGNAPPEWLKPLLSHDDQKVASDAKSYWNRMQAYSQLGSVAETRAFKEAVEQAGGVEALTDLVSKSQEIDSVDNAYYSADPQQQLELAERLANDDSEAFVSMTRIGNDVWKQIDPEGYQAHLSQTVRDTFNQVAGVNQSGVSNFEAHIAALEQAARAGDQNAVNDLVTRLVSWWGQNSQKLGFGDQQKRVSIDPNQAAVERARTQLAEQQDSFYKEKYQHFETSVLRDVSTQVDQRISAMVDKSLEGVKISDGMKKRLAAEIHDAIEQVVISDQAHRSKINQLMNSSPRGGFSQLRMDDQTRRQIVNLKVARASQALPSVAQKIISEWTADFIGANKSAAAKAKAAGARPDITGNVPRNYGGKKTLNDAIAEGRKSGKPLTDDDILNY